MVDSSFVVVDIGSPSNKPHVPSRNVDMNDETNDAPFYRSMLFVYILFCILVIIAVVITLLVTR